MTKSLRLSGNYIQMMSMFINLSTGLGNSHKGYRQYDDRLLSLAVP
jgi:hypothetical protein